VYTSNMDEASLRTKMQTVIELAASDINAIRTGRATPSLVEDVMVPAYGGQQRMRVMELASITAPDPQTLTISPWDKSIIGDIKKGLLEANLGFNPSIDGEIIRLSFPPLTGEDREKYVKLLGAKVEAGRVMVRKVRGDELKDIHHAFEKKEITEDEKFAKEKKLQEIADEFTERIETMGEKKKVELLEV
jgi:ribosome recycling factor